MKIGVSGASGKLGGAIVRELVSRGGVEVVAISRTPESAPEGVEGRYGNYDEADGLKQAYAGLDRLVLIPSVDPRPGARAQQNVGAINAAIAAGVKSILFISAIGVRNVPEPQIPASFFTTEQHLMRSSAEWTVLRMGAYAETFAQQVLQALPGGKLPAVADNCIAYVSREDVARAAAGVLVGEGHNGALYYATGPELVSGPERAKLVAEITGKPFEFVALGPDGYRGAMLGAGLPEPVANVLTALQAQQASGVFEIVTGDVERLSGIKPQSLRDVLAKSLT